MKERKHAYLIVAHDNFSILEQLIKSLNHPRNDIFIHIDTKVGSFDFERFANLATHSKIYFTPTRLDVKWADVSLIEVELLLYKTATQQGNYLYYHLISGVDMPIKTQEHIHNFLDAHQGQEFIVKEDYYKRDHRIRYIHFAENYYRRKDIISRLVCAAEIIFKGLQIIVNYNHLKNSNIDIRKIYKGPSWSSLTDPCVRHILAEMEQQLKWYKYSKMGDEVYKQTIVFNSPFAKNVYTSNLRLVDWGRGRPYTFRTSDFNEIIESDALFCRKFNESTDFHIVEMIADHLKK